MSVNSSSPSNSSLDLGNSNCSTVSVVTITAFDIIRLSTVLPLSIFILYLGYQQWRQQDSFQMMSHSDIFTYHLTVMELFWCLGVILYYCGFFFQLQNMITVGKCFEEMIFCGEICFHILICVERYLAVVYPIIYRSLRNARGIKIRNIFIGCIWLLCFVWSCLTWLCHINISTIIFFCILIFSLTIVSYCSLCVLCALIRPGPGEGGRNREQVDQSKQRAFFTVTAVTGVLYFSFLGILVTTALNESQLVSDSLRCTLWGLGICFNLPSTLVVPLLYLRRTGKLLCWPCNHQ